MINERAQPYDETATSSSRSDWESRCDRGARTGSRKTDFAIVGGCDWNQLGRQYLDTEATERLYSFVAPWPMERMSDDSDAGDFIFVNATREDVDWIAHPTAFLIDLAAGTPAATAVWLCTDTLGRYFLGGGLSPSGLAPAISPVGSVAATTGPELLLRLAERSRLKEIEFSAVFDYWEHLGLF